MKSGIFEALETLRAWYLQKQQDINRFEENVGWKEELEVIFKAFDADSIDSNTEL